jgi:hypothetical protein
VPDGVDTVEVTLGATTRRVSVANNFYVATFPPAPSGTPARGSARWLDADGRDVTP